MQGSCLLSGVARMTTEWCIKMETPSSHGRKLPPYMVIDERIACHYWQAPAPIAL